MSARIGARRQLMGAISDTQARIRRVVEAACVWAAAKRLATCGATIAPALYADLAAAEAELAAAVRGLSREEDGG